MTGYHKSPDGDTDGMTKRDLAIWAIVLVTVVAICVYLILG
jgi:hypothetical protein